MKTREIFQNRTREILLIRTREISLVRTREISLVRTKEISLFRTREISFFRIREISLDRKFCRSKSFSTKNLLGRKNCCRQIFGRNILLTENFAIITNSRQELILQSSALSGQAVSGINFAKFHAPRLGASELQVGQFVSCGKYSVLQDVR